MEDDEQGPARHEPGDDEAGPGATPGFRLAYVPGATPAKWVRTWRERLPDVPLELVATEAADAARVLRDGEADAAILRLPVDRDVLAAIPLYEETPVVLVGRDHLLAALEPEEPVALSDLADEVLLRPLDDVVAWSGTPGAADDAPAPPGRPAVERPATTADAVVLVAAGVGVLVVPQSLARLHHRKDVVHRRLDGAPIAPVALAWVAETADDLVEEMVGIVRGRTVNSSRGRASATTATAATGDGRAGAARSTGQGGTAAGRRAGTPSRSGRGAGKGAGGGRSQGRGTPRGGKGGAARGRGRRR
ncbi:substrate-binding domain-containing protein [Cellulosimicrobium sp. NPDC057127]|uniref:substrate-binding domain-containing protein n=1 Tax=Cellulosimicrobium sp. NPDC057127 TaxID=3346026 RepID=UPI003629BFDC